MRQHVSACVSTGQHGSAWRALPCRSRLSRTIAAARIDRGAPLTPYYYQRLRVNGLVVVVWSHKHGMGCAQVTYAIVRCTAHMLCFPPDWVYVHGARVPLKAMVWYGARASHSRPWYGTVHVLPTQGHGMVHGARASQSRPPASLPRVQLHAATSATTSATMTTLGLVKRQPTTTASTITTTITGATAPTTTATPMLLLVPPRPPQPQTLH